jgi:hypothetical protein
MKDQSSFNIPHIRLIAASANEKGDLFTRLVSDYLHALGNDEPRFDIHKPGREIDIIAHHRTENRVMIAECKAHAEKTGGDEINKFCGSADAEVEKQKLIKQGKDVALYFISLSGYTESVIEQEKEFDKPRCYLIDSPKIVKELINHKVLFSPMDVYAKASKLSEQHNLKPDRTFEILRHHPATFSAQAAQAGDKSRIFRKSGIHFLFRTRPSAYVPKYSARPTMRVHVS